MSEDAIKFEALQFRSEASEPLCETRARATTTCTVPWDKLTMNRLVVDKATDGGFLVLDILGAVRFASTTIDEALEYIQDRLS